MNEVIGPSLQLLQVTPDVLCACFMQASFLHTSQHCFALLAYTVAFCRLPPKAYPDYMRMTHFRALLRGAAVD